MHLCLTLLISCGLIAYSSCAGITPDQIKSFYSRNLDPNNYDKRVRPNQGEGPVEIGVTMYVIQIEDVPEKPQMFQPSFYFRQAWNDSRLAHNSNGPIVGDADLLDRIWKPDTFFASSVDAHFHNTMTPNVFVRIKNTGEVLMSMKTTQTIPCPSLHHVYNMNPTHCKLEIESYAFSSTDIIYKWSKGDNSVGIDDKLGHPNFAIAGHKQGEMNIQLSSGTYSRLVAEFILQPSLSAHFVYMKRLYPVILVTLMSFAPYFLPASRVRSLVTVLSSVMTSLLVVLVNNSLPVVNRKCNMTFFDMYGLTCIVFTIISVIHEIRQGGETAQEPEVTKSVDGAESQDKFRIPARLRERVTSKAVPLTFALVTIASGVYMLFINSYKSY